MDKIPNKYRNFLICAGLALISLVVFWQLRNYEFIDYDDGAYVTKNPQVLEGLTPESVFWAFTTGHAGNWHPLTWLSHMLDCQLFGLDAGWHHLTNVLLHVANTLLLFAVFKRMTAAPWRSAFVAAAFALHPLHVESVAWISERKDVLSTLFWLLTMAAYLHYVRRPGTVRYLLTLLVFALGLMAKPMLVTLPFVLLLLDYWPLGRFELGQAVGNANRQADEAVNSRSQRLVLYRLVWEKVPFFALSAISSFVTFLVQRSAMAVATTEMIPLISRISNTFISYLTYIEKMFWPSRLAVFYPHPLDTISTWQSASSALLLLAISIWIIRSARSHRYLLVGWLWYLGTLVPVIGLVQVGSQALADRYSYVPLIGLFIIIAWDVPELLTKLKYRKIVLGTSTLIVFLALAICTRFQLRHWRTSTTLFERALAVTSRNSTMHNNLGMVLNNRYGELDKAFEHFVKAVTINPKCADAHSNLGVVLFRQGNPDKAVAHFIEALRIRPNFADAHKGLGDAFLLQGNLDKTLKHYTEALRIKPDLTDARNNLGALLSRQGRFDEAITHFEEALRIKPDYVDAQSNLGYALAQQGRLGEAIIHYTEALRINPDLAQAHKGLGYVLARQGKFEQAAKEYQQVLRMLPENANVHNELGTVLLRQDRHDKAIKHFKEALRIKPDWVSPMHNLSRLLATHKETKFHNPQKAIQLAERACELTNYKQPKILDTLAVAYAAADRFSEAAATAEKAFDLAQSLKQKGLAEQIQNHLQLYKAGLPYLEPAPVQDTAGP